MEIGEFRKNYNLFSKIYVGPGSEKHRGPMHAVFSYTHTGSRLVSLQWYILNISSYTFISGK